MKVAVLSESEADETAVRVLVDGVLGAKTDRPLGPAMRIRTRGWPAVLHILPTVVRHLHDQSDASGLVVLVDSDLSPMHELAHEEDEAADSSCRRCQLAETLSLTMSRLRAVAGKPPMKTAIGVAVPQIEAWYLAGIDPHVNEAAWASGLRSGTYIVHREKLKKAVYGTERPPLTLEIEIARRHAERIVRDGHLALLERLFPSGFGAMASELRRW